MQHIHDTGVAINYRKAEQVWNHYYRTMFSLKTVAADLRRARSEAAELREKVREAARSFWFMNFLIVVWLK